MNSLKGSLGRVLRWSERYTRTDMIYLASGGFWLGVGYLFQFVSGVALLLAFTNLIPKESYGTYQFIISLSALLSGFTLTGLGTALMRSVARGASGALPYAFRVQLVWGLGIVVASAAVSLYYFEQGNDAFALAFLAIGALAPLLSAFSLYRPYLEGKRLFKESVFEGAWRRPIPVVALLTALFLTDDPVLLVIVYFASHALSMGLLYARTVRRHPEPVEPHPEMVSYGRHLSVMSFIGLVGNNLDNVIVYGALGPSALAAYALAQLPLTHTLKLLSQGGSLIFPKFASRSFAEIREGIGYKLMLYALVAGGAVAAYLMLAPYLFGLLFPAYPEAVIVSQVLMLAVLAKPFTLYAQAFAAHGRTGVQHFVQISVTAVKLSLLLLLIPAYGIWGAVAAVLGSTIYWCAALVVLFYARS